MKTRWILFLVAASSFLLLPTIARAQSSITGVVRDTSGAVLPGVTIEASSPALIERVRTTVTDDQGRYRIVDLRPGAYTVTFALAGFTTSNRAGLERSDADRLQSPRRSRGAAGRRWRQPSGGEPHLRRLRLQPDQHPGSGRRDQRRGRRSRQRRHAAQHDSARRRQRLLGARHFRLR